ncbi:MAG TPA: NADH-quinone oxidoreductase subunit N [bacterium]|nr:NADH-quinone oxidoreductase subunit N [bacterium]
MIQVQAFLPELWLVATAFLVIIAELIQKSTATKTLVKVIAVVGVVGALLSLCCVGGCGSCPFNSSCSMESIPQAFNGFLKTDGLAIFFKFIILMATLFTLLISFRYFKANPTHYMAEFIAVLLFSAAGASALTSAQEIITLYVALETLTISSYLLASFMKKDKGSNEAGMKYLLLGAFSSALLLFGFSYLYGFTGTTVISEIGKALATQVSSPLLTLAVIMIIAGLAFKISLAPFHLWTPDVYEGAPTPITAYLSVASKTAGFAAFVRLFWVGLSVPALQPTWIGLFAVLAVLSIILGNLEALPQRNIKRLMAYSSIAQAGYISTGFLVGGQLGLTAVLFYIFVYLFANMGVFLAITIVYAKTGSDQIEDYAGMWKRSPLIGVVLLVCLLSLAGVPPFAGFAGKWYLFGAAISKGYTWIALTGMVFSVVSLYYYLQVARQAFFPEPKDPSPIEMNWVERSVLIICVVFTITLGFWPTPVMQIAQSAASSLFN